MALFDYEKLPADYSTINLKRLRRLPVYKLPPTYQLSRHMGAACAGDAPGFPSYFLQSVYNQYGNPTRHTPHNVIKDPTTGLLHIVHGKEWYPSGDYWNAWKKPLFRLWKPLDIRHERVRLWMQAQYVHFNHCYYDPEDQKYGSHTLIWPIPDYVINDIEAPFRVLIKRAERSGDNVEYRKQYAHMFGARLRYKDHKWCLTKPYNHQAVRSIREFYPEHEPIVEWIEEPPYDGYEPNQLWWERSACPKGV